MVEQLVAEWVIRLLSGPALSAATGEDRAERDRLETSGRVHLRAEATSQDMVMVVRRQVRDLRCTKRWR
jgi:hypothetical protein